MLTSRTGGFHCGYLDLFEEKALVDFEIEELVKLVKALFADTSLRANTINKLMQGHHVS